MKLLILGITIALILLIVAMIIRKSMNVGERNDQAAVNDQMVVIECPNCNRHFESEIREDIEVAIEMAEITGNDASLKIPCPACQVWIALPKCEVTESPALSNDMIEGAASDGNLLPEKPNRQVDFKIAR